MPVITLDPDNRAEVHALLTDTTWSVACLCAAWCDVCTGFRSRFDLLAERHPDKVLLWIDIENESDIVGDFDVENFPTLLIQRGTHVAFYGTIEPDISTAHRLVTSHARGIPERDASAPPGPTGDADAGRPDLRSRLASELAAGERKTS